MNPHYERLSMEDTNFLALEQPTAPMHIGGVMIFERGPLATQDGGVAIDTFRDGIASVLHRVPRFRQKLKWIPWASHPVWVDDPHFDLHYHVRHTSLPRPGTGRQLRALVGRVMSQRLDRSKPLWEYWVIEGLGEDRFAVFTKIHHCMMDGTAGADLSHVTMSIEPGWTPEAPPPYAPRPEPGDRQLLRDALMRRAGQPMEALRRAGNFLRETENIGEELRGQLSALREVAQTATSTASSVVAGTLSPHRRCDWRVTALDTLKQVRRQAGGTLNDVVLATVAGAFRTFLAARGADPDAVSFKTVVPVNVREEGDHELGNKISTWLLTLPIGESAPRRRLEIITATTSRLKESNQGRGTHLMMQFAEFAPSSILSLAARASSGVADTFVTNVPGPQFPLYMFGARMLALLPQVPLLPGMGIAVGAFSYDGHVCWGVTSDAELVPDIDEFGNALERSLAELAASYGIEEQTSR